MEGRDTTRVKRQHESPFLLFMKALDLTSVHYVRILKSFCLRDRGRLGNEGPPILLKLECCPKHPIRNGSPNWCRSVADRDGSSLCVSLGHVDGSSWWCRFVTVCQFAMDLENIFNGVMVCGENVGGSSPSGWIVTTRCNLNGWCLFLTVCQFARVLGVMVCGENVSESSRSGRIATTPHNHDGW